MNKDKFDPQMEWQKLKFEALAQIVRYVAKHGLAIVVLFCVVGLLILDRQERGTEFRQQITEAKTEFSAALNLSRAEMLLTKQALDSCDAQRLALSIRVARLEILVQQIRKR